MKCSLIILAVFFCHMASGEDFLKSITTPPPEFRDDFGELRSPLLFENGDLVKTAEQWEERRTGILREWSNLMGQWPEVITAPEVVII